MNRQSIDYAYALELCGRFNRLVEGNPQLRKVFEYKGWNLLQAYQGALFEDAKIWTRGGAAERTRSTLHGHLLLKAVISAVFQIVVSLLSALYFIVANKKFLVFSGDKANGSFGNDSRLEALYGALGAEGTSFGEILHSTGGAGMVRNFLRRGRPVIYLESIDVIVAPWVWLKRRETHRLSSALNLDEFDKDEQRFIRFALVKYVSATFITRVRLRALKSLLGSMDLRAAMSIDDTRHYNELMGAAEELGIHSYAIQHGHFTKYHTGWMKQTSLPGKVMKPEFLVVWSEYWKRELLRLGSVFAESEIVVGGNRSDVRAVPHVVSDRLAVLIPYEKDAPKSQMLGYIKRLIDARDVEVIFKLRGDEDAGSQLEEYGLADLVGEITVTNSVDEVISRVGVAAGTYSTLLYDTVALERPVAILESSIDYGEGMVANNLATLVTKEQDTAAALKEIARLNPSELAQRRERLAGAGGRKLQRTLQDIITKYV